jgi:hypothetical protein
MSGPYGRQEMHDGPGASPEPYLELLDQRRPSPQMKDEVLPYSDLRWRMFTIMAGNPDEEWTAESLVSGLRSGSDADSEALRARIKAVHDAMTELMGDRWAEPVPFQQHLTVRLTTTGQAQVQRLLAAWQDDVRG